MVTPIYMYLNWTTVVVVVQWYRKKREKDKNGRWRWTGFNKEMIFLTGRSVSHFEN